MKPSGTLEVIINAACCNAARRGHKKVLPDHVAEAALQARSVQSVLKTDFGGELDQASLLRAIQVGIAPASEKIPVEEVELDASYERLMGLAEGKALSNDRDSISPRCVLAAIASMEKTTAARTFYQFGLTEERLDQAITLSTKKRQPALA